MIKKFNWGVKVFSECKYMKLFRHLNPIIYFVKLLLYKLTFPVNSKDFPI